MLILISIHSASKLRTSGAALCDFFRFADDLMLLSLPLPRTGARAAKSHGNGSEQRGKGSRGRLGEDRPPAYIRGDRLAIGESEKMRKVYSRFSGPKLSGLPR